MGIREMLDEIKTDTLSSVTKNIEDAKSKANNIIISKIDELEKFYAQERLSFDNKFSSLKKKLLGKLEMDILREKQERLSALYKSFIEEILLDITKEIKKEKKIYLDFLFNIIDDAIKELKDKKIDLIMSYEDKGLSSEIKKRFKKFSTISFSNIIGGVIIKTEDTYIDASLNYIFTKLKPEILKIMIGEIGE